MKRISLFIPATICMAVVQGQSTVTRGEQKEIFLFAMNAIAIVLAMYIGSTFLLTLVRLFLNTRLKKALLEKQASAEVIKLMLPKETGHLQDALKWGCVGITTGVGLTICYFTQPLGLHSIIILTFSVSIGFFLFFFLLKRNIAAPPDDIPF